MTTKFETPKISELTPTNLNEYAILIAFHKKSWTPSARDARIEGNTKEREGYYGEARLYKQLVSKSWLEDFRANARAARKFHDENTLPWADLGYRILVASNYQSYIEAMSEFVMTSKRLVQELQEKWPEALEEARALWPGETFNPDDYPTVDEIPELFMVDWTERPIPNSEDFRLKDINPAMQKRMQEKLDADLTIAISEAMVAPWEKIFGLIKKIVDGLSSIEKNERSHFEYTTLSNLATLVSIMPGLNISNDPKLQEIADEAGEILTKIGIDENSTPEEVQKAAKHLKRRSGVGEAFREDVLGDTKKALDKMSGFMGGAS